MHVFHQFVGAQTLRYPGILSPIPQLQKDHNFGRVKQLIVQEGEQSFIFIPM